ncbi:septin-interacting protein 1 [Eurosta solidaginis]|uniref:septin-interacting protein 1 n=1 Tax=Eurosta solidaginis TaxID=178769 RepID=UPI003530D0EA
MSDNEYERFEITDYDLDNEFNPGRRRHPTKNQQIYGIWADDSDNDSGEETSNRRGRRGAGRRPKDYSAPVSFVAGGIQQAGKKDKKKKEEDDEVHEISDDESDADDGEERPSFGRKQVEAGGGEDSASETSSDDERTREKRAEASKQQRSSSGQHTRNPNVGAWERHTRGIGAKLLLQMGYQPGKGLGKELQGISQPVQAQVRKGRGAIGAYGPETAASVGGKGPVVKEDDDVCEAKEFKEKLNKWKKTTEGRQDKGKRYYYRSVEEVIEKGKKGSFMLSDKFSKKIGNVPVIDMTGPEKRVLSGYHALGQSKVPDEELYDLEQAVASSSITAKKGSTFALPELTHNLQLIVNLCEQDIITLDKAEREATDRQAALEHERKNLNEIVQLEKNHIDTLEQALKLVEELTQNNETLTLQRAEQIFATLQQNYAAEYQEFALGDLAAGVIAPLLKISIENWKPLEQPTQHVELIKKWRGILDTNADPQNESRNIFDPYSSLVWAGVIPSFRACAASWNPKQHQPMAALLDCWAPLFPTWILDSVLEQLVLPQLNNGVRDWDPLTDTVPIHMWILPWNNILGHKMEEFIFPTIREKLAAALQAWMPQDRSARAMLTPWKGAFDDIEMQRFLTQHIIPKLQMVLNEFIINPLQQQLELWNQVWEWHELLTTHQMSLLLDKYFFPKWMQVLVLWLNQSPDYAEISRWYTGWKSMFTEEILREPLVKEHLRRALEIMHRATDVQSQGSASTTLPKAPNMNATQQQPLPPPVPAPALMDLQIPAPVQLEFKELVSQKCAERGILFAPMPGRRELGKQVYRVGKLYCYIDRNVCMLSDSTMKNWMPISMQQLMDRAVTGVL